MIVADSSIWIDHLKIANLNFRRLLIDGFVLMHPYVVGELALGSLKDRKKTLADLASLASIRVAAHGDVMNMIEQQRLFSRGIGYVDAHLLAACLINDDCNLLTRDRRLHEAAEQLGIAA